jgi:hypothetical protein
MNRPLTLSALLLVVFVATVAVLLQVIPSPHKSTDYLVIGALATLLCIVILYFLLIKRDKPNE